MTFTQNVYNLGDVKVVLNEGMPQYKNPFDKGRLIIAFSVSVCWLNSVYHVELPSLGATVSLLVASVYNYKLQDRFCSRSLKHST